MKQHAGVNYHNFPENVVKLWEFSDTIKINLL